MARNNNRLFSQAAVSAAIDELIERGYSIAPLPCSLLDPCVAIAPDDKHYHFIFDEVYLNEWSSAYRVYRRAKLPKRIVNAIAEAEAYGAEAYTN